MTFNQIKNTTIIFLSIATIGISLYFFYGTFQPKSITSSNKEQNGLTLTTKSITQNLSSISSFAPKNNSDALISSQTPLQSLATSSKNIIASLSPKIETDNREIDDKINIQKSERTANNSTKSCYISYKRKVYDITTFLSKHPGGASRPTSYCGKEVDDLSEIHGGGSFDSNKIQAVLGPKYIGELQ